MGKYRNLNESPSLIRVAKYLRVSSDKQAKTGDSLREQDETLTEYINKNFNMILYDTYIDDGVSGQKLQRDDFTRLIDDAKSRHIDLIIFTKLDRWFRSLRHYLNTQAILEEHSVMWTAVSQPFFDTTTAHGRAFVAQSMTWAELEAQNDSERILAVFENKVKNGEVISGNTPLGYKIVDKHLIPDENAPIVVRIFDEYAKTSNLASVLRMMREEFGIDRTTSTIRKLLKHRIYIGEYRGNLNYCPSIIDRNVFEQVQYNLSKNIKSSRKHEYIYAGLVRCDCCGNAFAAHQILVHGHPRKDGTRLKYRHSGYRCKRRYDMKDCINKKIVYESVLERWMLEHLPENIENYISEHEITTAPITNIANKRKSIEKKIDKLKELYVNDLISIDEFKIDRSRYEEQLLAIPNVISPIKDISTVKKLLTSNVLDIYATFSITEKQRFWRSFVDEIRIDNERNITVVFR